MVWNLCIKRGWEKVRESVFSIRRGNLYGGAQVVVTMGSNQLPLDFENIREHYVAAD